MKKLDIKKLLLVLAIVFVNGSGAAFSIKAAIGNGAWDAIANSLSQITAIKVGTIGFLFNIMCIVGELYFGKQKFSVIHIVQVLMSYVNGFACNLVLYNGLSSVLLSNYIFRIVFLLIGNVVTGTACGILVSMDFISFPLEGLCTELSKITKFEFGKIRMGVDAVCIVLSVILCVLFHKPLTAREGTVISMFLFSPIMVFVIGKAQPVLERIGLKEKTTN